MYAMFVPDVGSPKDICRIGTAIEEKDTDIKYHCQPGLWKEDCIKKVHVYLNNTNCMKCII